MGGVFIVASHFASQFLVVLVHGAGLGLDLRAPNKIKTVRPAWVVRPTQNPTGQRNPTKKRTVWCVFKRVAFVGLEPSPEISQNLLFCC